MPVSRRLPVCDHDLANLRTSGLTDEEIRAAGIYTEYDRAVLARILNYEHAPPFTGGAMVFRHFDTEGNPNCFHTVKPHQPRFNDKGKEVKYESPHDKPPQAYVGPASRARMKAGALEIIVVEGIKKALAVEQLGYTVISLSGVYNWKVRDEERLQPDLASIEWAGRTVYICFDYDPKPKTQSYVATAARRLGRLILKASAVQVRVTDLPPGPDGTKNGIDDHLATVRLDQRAAVMRGLLDAAQVLVDGFSNYTEEKSKNTKDEETTVKVGKTSAAMQRELHQLTGGWPKRTGELLFARRGDEPLWIVKTPDLFAYIGAQIPRPVQWVDGSDKVSEAVFHAHLKQNVECFTAVEALPHCPPLDGHYYIHPLITGGDGEHLLALLDAFCPATPVDHMLLKALFLTPFWGGPPGARPCFLIEAADEADNKGRGVGKSTLAKCLSRLAGGHIDIRQTDDFSKTTSRMLTPAVLTKRIALLDNVKSLKFSWADLEGLITGQQINGHQLYVGDASRPNTITFIITMNGANMSKDMAGRSVPIRLKTPSYMGEWEEQTNRFIDEHRLDIIGDIITELARDKPILARSTRWGAWEASVLACVEDPMACQDLIAERQAAIDSDNEESDTVRDGIAEALRKRGHSNPDADVVFIPSGEMAKIVNEATGQNFPTNKVSGHLKTLTIGELSKTDRTDLGGRGWIWRGKGAVSDTRPSALGAMVETLRGRYSGIGAD